jgi:hypothetical protein
VDYVVQNLDVEALAVQVDPLIDDALKDPSVLLNQNNENDSQG